MNDTSPEIARMVKQRYMQMKGEERFLIGIQMFETARTIVLSSLPAGATEQQKRQHLCERFYKTFTPKIFPQKRNCSRD